MAAASTKRVGTITSVSVRGWSKASRDRSAPSTRSYRPKRAPRIACSFRVSTDGDGPDRHRRLDLSAMARRVLPGQIAAVERAGICLASADGDRDQRDLLRPAKPQELAEMGRD